MNVVGTLSLSLIPGMYVDISIPSISQTDTMPNGMLPKTGTFSYKGEERDLMRGFFLDNEYVGQLSELPEDADVELKPRIRYTHNKPFPNRIYFIDIFSSFAVVDIVAIPIHDHSSITQGGPAFGTYYSNYNKIIQDQNTEN